MAHPGEALRKKQSDFILSQLSTLLEITELNAHTLSILQQNKVLGSADISKLDAIPDKYEKNGRFYQVITSRLGFFEVLTEAMEITCQNGVASILNSFNPGSCEPPKSSCRSRGHKRIVVGSKECPVFKVTFVLSQLELVSIFNDHWTKIARDLETPGEKVKQLKKDHLLNMTSITEIVSELIELWVGRNGRDATLDVLVKVYTENGMKSAADALEEAFPQ